MSVQEIDERSLPTEFENVFCKNHTNTKEICIRSNVKTMDDINKWVSLFGTQTNTQWNARSSKPEGIKIICSKKFVCHHNGFMKVAAKENKRGLSKNFNCQASILVVVKLNTINTRRKDAFIKKGLQSIITIRSEHNHTLETAETLRFLQDKSYIKDLFFEYFNDGMTITRAKKFHEQQYEFAEDKELILASGSKNPTYRTVQNWYHAWRKLNVGPRSGEGLVEGTSGEEDESFINTPKNQQSSVLNVAQNAAPIHDEPLSNLPIKLESEVDDFEFKYVPLEITNHDMSEDTEPEIKLENFEIIKNAVGDSSECSSVFGTPYWCKEIFDSKSEQPVGVKKEELDVKEEDLEPSKTGYKECFLTHQEALVRTETGQVINDTGQRHEVVHEDLTIKKEEPDVNEEELKQKECFVTVETSQMINEPEKIHEIDCEDWEIKNEELDINEDDVEQTGTSMVPDCSCQDKQDASKHSTEDNRKIYNFNLKKHLLRHINPEGTTLKCRQCEFQTVHKITLGQHLLQHKNLKVNEDKCSHCEQTIRDSYLKRHLLRHFSREVNKFQCTQCEYQTLYKNNFKQHLMEHVNPEKANKFQCTHCEYQTFKKNHLKKHLLRHANPEEVYHYKCTQCKYQSRYKSNLKVHFRRHTHLETVVKLKCYHCDYQTLDKDDLNRHNMRLHVKPAEDSQFKCAQCDYQTRYRSNLTVHSLVHVNPEEINLLKCSESL